MGVNWVLVNHTKGEYINPGHYKVQEWILNEVSSLPFYMMTSCDWKDDHLVMVPDNDDRYPLLLHAYRDVTEEHLRDYRELMEGIRER